MRYCGLSANPVDSQYQSFTLIELLAKNNLTAKSIQNPLSGFHIYNLNYVIFIFVRITLSSSISLDYRRRKGQEEHNPNSKLRYFPKVPKRSKQNAKHLYTLFFPYINKYDK